MERGEFLHAIHEVGLSDDRKSSMDRLGLMAVNFMEGLHGSATVVRRSGEARRLSVGRDSAARDTDFLLGGRVHLLRAKEGCNGGRLVVLRAQLRRPLSARGRLR